MPEIAEIARIVHFLRLHLVGKTIKTASAIDDANVFGKVGTTGAQVAAALIDRKVVSSGSQGKYFWITLDKPPHLVMHFGMTGWIQIKGAHTSYSSLYRDTDSPEEAWPPKFTKFHLTTISNPPVEVAFTDPRRFGRVRLVDCPGDSIRQYSPLVENGPDPVVDADRFTLFYFQSKVRSRRTSIKALLLDQTFISGIGNWVADEVLFQSRLHPEQVCNSFTDNQIKTLFEVIRYVCQTAVAKLGDYHQFPADWLFKHRWGKGGKVAKCLPGGEPLAFLTVGGRTSCYAPGLQKKTGDVSSGVKEITAAELEKPTKLKKPPKKEEEGSEAKPTAKRKRKAEDTASPFFYESKSATRQKKIAKAEQNEDDAVKEEDDLASPTTQPKPTTRQRGKTVEINEQGDATVAGEQKLRARREAKVSVKVEEGVEDDPISVESYSNTRRRSARLSGV
ncbi:hypothetical protein QBC36DRAFT_205530 [Triangularia setosa]|uniref:Formamidopyrimidine-DNA glycosylase catalytic domain-containing protein n=1 Tax=Triangularia setosa TaxID=2587417 RepID=A0AAN6WDQ4_9PEZI|nr:hypothetical protein QBC36DRAFT_205530 [Podospora setosa]